MKPGLSTYSLRRWREAQGRSITDAVDWIAAHNAGAVEFVHDPSASEFASLDAVRRLREHCEAAGVPIAGYCAGGELLHDEPEDQREAIEQAKHHVSIAAELGAASMRVDLTRGPEDRGLKLGEDEVLERVVPGVREIADHAASLGVICTLENHGFYMQTADRIERLMRAVDHRNYRLTIDLGNFLCLNQDPVEATRRLSHYVVMVHAKDFHVRPDGTAPPGAPAIGDKPELRSGWMTRPPGIDIRGAICGHGDVDLPAQLRILREAGYEGYVSLEFEGIEENEMAVRLGLAYLEQQLAAIAGAVA